MLLPLAELTVSTVKCSREISQKILKTELLIWLTAMLNWCLARDAVYRAVAVF